MWVYLKIISKYLNTPYYNISKFGTPNNWWFWMSFPPFSPWYARIEDHLGAQATNDGAEIFRPARRKNAAGKGPHLGCWAVSNGLVSVSSYRGTPKYHHPISRLGFFHEINHPAIKGYPHFPSWKPPIFLDGILSMVNHPALVGYPHDELGHPLEKYAGHPKVELSRQQLVDPLVGLSSARFGVDKSETPMDFIPTWMTGFIYLFFFLNMFFWSFNWVKIGHVNSPTSQWLGKPKEALPFQDRSVRVWDLNTLAMLASLEQASACHDVAWKPIETLTSKHYWHLLTSTDIYENHWWVWGCAHFRGIEHNLNHLGLVIFQRRGSPQWHLQSEAAGFRRAKAGWWDWSKWIKMGIDRAWDWCPNYWWWVETITLKQPSISVGDDEIYHPLYILGRVM